MADAHQRAVDATVSADAAMEAMRRAAELALSQRDAAALEHARLSGRWYVRWGRGIERALWLVGVAWLAAGVAAVVLGLGSPLSWAYRISREIVRLVPVMNPFAWVRDWLAGRRRTC